MRFLRLLPTIASALLIAAHFLRAELYPLVALSLAFPLLLLVRKVWATRLVQVMLVLGAAEWIRTMVDLVALRRAIGQPFAATVVILTVVAAFTIASALFLEPTKEKGRGG